MINHEFVAFHHTSFMIFLADVDDRIRLFQNRAGFAMWNSSYLPVFYREGHSEV